MKTTIDLPPDLVREMKLLAAHEGRKLKDVVADLETLSHPCHGLRAWKKRVASRG